MLSTDPVPSPAKKRVACVLGGLGGIGHSVSRVLDQNCWTVIIGSRNAAGLNQAADSSHVVPLPGSPSDPAVWAALQNLAERSFADCIDCIIVSTGNLEFVSSLDMTRGQVEAAMDAHFYPALNALQYATRQARRNPDSRCVVIFVGSTLCHEAEMDAGPYVVAKHALLGLYRAACEDQFGLESRLAVKIICPPNVDTPLWTKAGLATGVPRPEGPDDSTEEPLKAETIAQQIYDQITQSFSKWEI
ncbi:hypothetical protein PAPYR_7228 [Paratrimastix pyriformis]|uniref:Uncharacterized protein n=1 Tax=Paratrimastix pyriformis TaxID=342808 RepID=A0ABQ8UFX4_9EUKA|nr:hypothetical protein PAPYR_7228 [Paratrimastix pyriformis]